MTYRVVRRRTIAGICIVHQVEADIPIRSGDESWLSAGGDDQVIIRHRVGEYETAGLPTTYRIDDRAVFFDAGDGNVVARFREVGNGGVGHTLRAVVPGSEYEFGYPEQPHWPLDLHRLERKAMTFALMERRRGLVAHACAFVMPSGRSVLCPALADIGKSTLARLLIELGGIPVLSDDRVLILHELGGFRFAGTPWHSDAGVMSGISAPAGRIVLLTRGPGTVVRSINASAALPRLFNTIALPFWSANILDWALGYLDTLLVSIPLLEGWYEPDPDSLRRWLRLIEEGDGHE